MLPELDREIRSIDATLEEESRDEAVRTRRRSRGSGMLGRLVRPARLERAAFSSGGGETAEETLTPDERHGNGYSDAA